jgi:hypothetical protein
LHLNAIFTKDVQRPIEGVIKADDVAHLGTEVEEYVLTNEAASSLEHLLEAYTDYTNANGVWISGFFGSGKSHLLKMLAHLLGDVDGQDFPRERVSTSFRDKAPDAFLLGLLDKADRIPAKSLLFNIDQKATLITKDQSDALLKVFMKVFDESRGYFGNQGHVARFERDLDNRGQYESFKDAYQRISGRPWTQGREEGVLEEGNVARAYAEVSGHADQAPENILAKYRAEYSVSIEDFADEVANWLDKQEQGFRLNFFVDEVGQFIGTNTHLMLNLQTIAESLNTKCQGRAWVLVTSQEDMDKVVGDRTKQQGSDFSKIQARFATRVKLTSADVEEVIRKRLLEKNDAGRSALSAIYADQSANFKTLFDFVDGAKTYRNYVDEDQFTGTYPFVSYQFPLFQAAIEGISDHNVFEGRNSSVGERSMLGVVQQVAKDIGNIEVGRLATFDEMFAGIRSSLKSAAQRAIDVAERHLDDKLAVRLLKALFLVKYVEGFKATPRNLTVLVYDQFGLDLPALSKRVKEALALLETQSYVQRNGEVYEYLTDDEKRIEEEIKNVDIDTAEVNSRLFKILSGDVLRVRKIRYAKNGQDFGFGYKLDDQVQGPQQELTVHFISPEYEYDAEQIRMHGAGRDELRVILGRDDRIMSDLRLLIKTDKYTKRKRSASLSPVEDQILNAKATLNTEREKELTERLKRAVGSADLVVNAVAVESSSQDPVQRVTDGFQQLIGHTYTQLRLLGGTVYSEQRVAEFADPDQPGLVDDASLSTLAVPGDEVFALVTRREGLAEQVTVRTILEHFQAKPYGWDLWSTVAVIAWLSANAKVTLSADGSTLKRSEIARTLRNTQKHPHTVVTVQKTFEPRKVASFRKFCMDFFDEPNPPKDPLELARHGSDKLAGSLSELRALAAGARYPFLSLLDEPVALLEQATGKTDEWYLTDFALGDELLEAKEDVIDPIRGFFAGGQKAVYDEARDMLVANASNLEYLTEGSDTEVRRMLADPAVFRGNRTTQLKRAADALREQIHAELGARRAAAIEMVEARKAEIIARDDFANAAEDAKQDAVRAIEDLVQRLGNLPEIAVIQVRMDEFERTTYPALLDRLAESASTVDDDIDTPSPARQTVSVKTITVPGVHGRVLEDSEDVDRYLAALRSALLATIDDGKRIAL